MARALDYSRFNGLGDSDSEEDSAPAAPAPQAETLSIGGRNGRNGAMMGYGYA